MHTGSRRNGGTDYCKTCGKQAAANQEKLPNAGDIRSRAMAFKVATGKQVNYGNVMEKLGISRQEAEAAAAEMGVEIPEEQFAVVKGRRGRPKKDSSTTSSSSGEDEAEVKPKKRGRPKKEKKVVSTSSGDDLLSQLVAQAQDTSDESSSNSDSDADALNLVDKAKTAATTKVIGKHQLEAGAGAAATSRQAHPDLCP